MLRLLDWLLTLHAQLAVRTSANSDTRGAVADGGTGQGNVYPLW